MAGQKKITVVISQAPGRNPAKRQLEEELAAALLVENDVDVSLVPHLNDLTADHSGLLYLRRVPGDVVILSWLYPRAARWILDRNGVKGQMGISLLKSAEAGDDEGIPAEEEARPNAIGALEVPKRKLYCLDLRDQSEPRVYLDEIRRIAREASVQTVGLDLMQWIGGSPQPAQLQRYLNPFLPVNGAPAPGAAPSPGGASDAGEVPPPAVATTDEPPKRRWYPIIDYSRCTNCMECIDFCLFGVYGVDTLDRILVEQQDNCKKGCPACSRVCPENAIIFPEHKTPAIAGAEVERDANFKIDLSKLFGAPSALEIAAQERDTELVRDGREAVGMSVGVPKRQETKPAGPRDALDDLMDDLDKLSV